MPECLSENVVLDWIEGRLDATSVSSVAQHIDACASCRQLVADAGQGSDDIPLRKGATLGRYVILDVVGAGAMGVVYAAYDPELDRKLALKLLRADLEDVSSLGLRLRREAQALAKLAHPNVVTVHDVGAVGDRVFLAIEFVDGGTLTRWLHSRERSWREILAMFRQVGEGLHAAHEAGLVHRDFKPDNVLVGQDGRPRVTDFGLARPVGTAPAVAVPESSLAMDLLATPTGAIVGTPAFMAPEQRSGSVADARSDLYSFCVALYWALHGVHPSKGVPEGGPTLPGWLRRILARGLRERPEDRYPDMRALLDALGRGPLVTPYRALAAVALVALGAIAFALRPPPPCTGAEAAFGDVWDAHSREAIRARFGNAGGTHAFDLVDHELSAFRAAWLAMYTDACQATHVRGEQSEALLDLRMRCLQDRRKDAAALVEIFSDADAAVVGRAGTALEALRPLAGCADAHALISPVPLPDDPRKQAEIDRLESQLARSNALYYAGRMKEATEVALSALEPARALGYRPLEARLLYAAAHATKGQGHSTDAERLAHQAAIAAEAARDDGTAVDAFTLLVYVVGFVQGRVDEGKRWADYAAAALERLGGDTDREISLLGNEVLLYWDDTPEHALRARGARERAHPEGPRPGGPANGGRGGGAGRHLPGARQGGAGPGASPPLGSTARAAAGAGPPIAEELVDERGRGPANPGPPARGARADPPRAGGIREEPMGR